MRLPRVGGPGRGGRVARGAEPARLRTDESRVPRRQHRRRDGRVAREGPSLGRALRPRLRGAPRPRRRLPAAGGRLDETRREGLRPHDHVHRGRAAGLARGRAPEGAVLPERVGRPSVPLLLPRARDAAGQDGQVPLGHAVGDLRSAARVRLRQGARRGGDDPLGQRASLRHGPGDGRPQPLALGEAAFRVARPARHPEHERLDADLGPRPVPRGAEPRGARLPRRLPRRRDGRLDGRAVPLLGERARPRPRARHAREVPRREQHGERRGLPRAARRAEPRRLHRLHRARPARRRLLPRLPEGDLRRERRRRRLALGRCVRARVGRRAPAGDRGVRGLRAEGPRPQGHVGVACGERRDRRVGARRDAGARARRVPAEGAYALPPDVRAAGGLEAGRAYVALRVGPRPGVRRPRRRDGQRHGLRELRRARQQPLGVARGHEVAEGRDERDHARPAARQVLLQGLPHAGAAERLPLLRHGDEREVGRLLRLAGVVAREERPHRP